MKELKSLRLFISLLLFFVSYNTLRADERTPEQAANISNKGNEIIQFTPAKRDDKQAKLKQAAEEKAKKEKLLKESLSSKEKENQAKLKVAVEQEAKEVRRLQEADLAKQEKQAKLKEAAQERVRKKEQKESEAEARAQEKQQESALKEALRDARTEEAARKKEEQLEEAARVKEKRSAELRARQEEKLKREAERKAQEEQLKAQREREAEIKQLKIEEARRARAEELARKKEEQLEEAARKKEEQLEEAARVKEKRSAELRARQEEKLKKEAESKAHEEERLRKEAERKAQEEQLKAQREREAEIKQLKIEEARRARAEELARKKEERLKELARAKEQKEAESKAHEEERLRKEAERKAQEEQLKAQREREAEAKRLKLEEEKKAREEELARKEEERLEAEAQERQERLEELARAREQREMEFQARQEELAQERQEHLEELIWAREQKETELRARQEELAQLETERQIREAELQAQREEEKQAQLRAQQEGLAKQREEAQAKINEAKKATTQEKVITDAMLKKQKEDQAKIEKIEKLWKRAKKLYGQERYEEAIKDFQKIIELEGNPRIKYTPEAKELIEKAKINMEQKKEAALSYKVELSEKEMINEVIEQQVPPYLNPPKNIEQQKEPTFLIEPPLIRKKLKATKITMDFDKVGLKSVIGFLAQESGINIVASQKVLELTPVVSARFKDTTLDEVIKYITKNLGLIYRVDKEVVWIASPEEVTNEAMETRIYYLNKGGGLFTEFSPMTTGTTETGLGGSSSQINKVFTIEDTLKEVIPWPSESKISYDKRLNALLVRNTPQNLQILEDILYNMDIEPLQVLIEARFIEVDITDTNELGVDWKIAKGDWQLKEKHGDFKAGLAQNTGVDFTAFTRAAEGMNVNYIGMLTNSQFQAVLHALEESKKIKTLSSPRITTLNNQIATIKVVDEWIYPTRYEFEILQVPGQLPSQTPTYEYKNVPKDFIRRDVGILLKVIPAVGADKKTINLSLIPEVSEGIADGFTYTGDVKLPKFTSRNLSTSVVVTSGDTVVLGGMIKENRTKTLTKVPVLGDLPFIGGFFKKNTDSTERKNLLIFVTAKVLSSSGEEVVVAQK